MALDLKSGMGAEHRLHRVIAPIVADAVAAGIEIHVSDWDYRALRLVKAAAPQAMTRGAMRGRLADWRGAAGAAELDALNLAWDCVRPSDVEVLHEVGLLVAFF